MDAPKKTAVTFTGPVVDPSVQDPGARAYAEQIAQRRSAAALPKYGEPVGGPPMPPIPRLDSQHVEGRTMAQQAPPPSPSYNPGGIFQAPQAQVNTPGVSPASFGILPSDILPEEVRQDPGFRDGQGAMYAAAQPALALKYGVIRQGQRVAPQQLRPGPRRSPQETIADLQKLAEFEKTRQAAESGDTKAEQDSVQGAGGAAARLANPSGDPDVRPLGDEEKEKLDRAKKALSTMDEFDFDAFRQAMMKDLLNNDEQKKIIEERLEPMDLDDMLTKSYVLQRVPIIPGKFEPTFRSMTGEDDLSMKRLIMQDSKSVKEVSDRYLLDKFSLMSIAAMTHAINSHLFAEIHDKDGNFDDDLFWKRFNIIIKQPYHMLASLGVNAFWFDVRVRKLFVAERIKNG